MEREWAGIKDDTHFSSSLPGGGTGGKSAVPDCFLFAVKSPSSHGDSENKIKPATM